MRPRILITSLARTGSRSTRSRRGRALSLLDTALADQAGVELEYKRYSLSVHDGRAPRGLATRKAIVAAVKRLLGDEVRIIPGKQVVNLVPLGAADKGEALQRDAAHGRDDRAVHTVTRGERRRAIIAPPTCTDGPLSVGLELPR